jgi:ATP adenylyltransferase
METLWAPWRIGYIMSEKPAGCVLCAKPAENRDSENFILYRGVWCYVVLNIYPYNNGHLMVVPFEHLASIELLSAETANEVMALARRSIQIIRQVMGPEGFNIGINQGAPAGAGIADHVHLHVVPRWVGDTNFMPVIGNTRVMPQSLESCYDLLARAFQELPEDGS